MSNTRTYILPIERIDPNDHSKPPGIEDLMKLHSMQVKEKVAMVPVEQALEKNNSTEEQLKKLKKDFTRTGEYNISFIDKKGNQSAPKKVRESFVNFTMRGKNFDDTENKIFGNTSKLEFKEEADAYRTYAVMLNLVSGNEDPTSEKYKTIMEKNKSILEGMYHYFHQSGGLYTVSQNIFESAMFGMSEPIATPKKDTSVNMTVVMDPTEENKILKINFITTSQREDQNNIPSEIITSQSTLYANGMARLESVKITCSDQNKLYGFEDQIHQTEWYKQMLKEVRKEVREKLSMDFFKKCKSSRNIDNQISELAPLKKQILELTDSATEKKIIETFLDQIVKKADNPEKQNLLISFCMDFLNGKSDKILAKYESLIEDSNKSGFFKNIKSEDRKLRAVLKDALQFMNIGPDKKFAKTSSKGSNDNQFNADQKKEDTRRFTR